MHEIIIEPNKTAKHLWQELWSYRELFYFLAWKDILVRYKQTVIGIAWSIVRPLLSMVILTIIFSSIAKLPSGNTPYPILVFVATLPWQFFSTTLTMSGNSLISNVNMITKVYFPRIIIPTAAMVVSLVDFIISFAILICMMFWFGCWPTWKVLVLPFFLFLAALTSLGVGYWIGALNVKYRDFRHIVPFVIRFGLYISPVGFSSNLVPGKWRLMYSVNPMVGVIDGFRWALLGKEVNIYLPSIVLSICIAIVLFTSGIWFFTKTERQFADII
jgi:lipopolysaccharide transport system permease protein